PKWEDSPKTLDKIEICPLSGALRGIHCPAGIFEYSKQKENLKTCDYHRGFRYPVYPPLYTQWVHEHGLDTWPLESGYYSSTAALIIYPPQGAVFKLDPTIPHSYQTLTFQVSGHNPNRTWFLDGEPLKEVDGKVQWALIKGSHHLVIKDGESITERKFEVK
ncbi:MAG: hypothetical protein ACD_73C00235G0002, partial [uncultured bacterium]